MAYINKKVLTELTLAKLYGSSLCLEKDIIEIQDKLGIYGYAVFMAMPMGQW